MPTPARYERSAGLIAALTFGSRVLGLVRESVFAYYFSTGSALSAFRIAFMIPNLARRLFGEGALSSALIPVLTQTMQRDGEAASRELVGGILRLLVLVLSGGVLAIEIVLLVVRSFHDDPALSMTAVMMPYMVLICTVAVIGGVLNVRDRFAVPAAAPMILNVVEIVGVVAAARWLGLAGMELMYAACVSVLVAGVLQLLASAEALRRASFIPAFAGAWFDPHIRSVTSLMVPMLLGLSTVQISTLLDYLIAYVFVVRDGERNGPAVLGYASTLYQLPLGVFGIAIATAIFPVLSMRAAKDDRAGLADVFSRGVRMSLYIAIPSAIGLIAVARPLVAVLFEHGEFGPESTARVAGVLVFYSLGMPAYFVQHIIVRTYYAIQDSKTPARSAAAFVGVNLVMNVALVFSLQERGLALATALCATVQSAWLARRLGGVVPQIAWRPIVAAVTRTLIAGAVMAGVLLALRSSPLAEALSGMRRSFVLTILVLTGAATFVGASWALRIDELNMVLRRRRNQGVPESAADAG